MSDSLSRSGPLLPKPPNAFLYWLAAKVCTPYLRLVYGLHIDRSGLAGLKGPVVVLSNHQGNTDFLITAAALYPIRLNFMVTTYFFHHRLLAFLLRVMGGIPKRQFLPDTTAVRMCLGIAKRGGSLGIFPEGQVCYTGRNSTIDPSIAKLCKKLGRTVVVSAIRGNHLTYPKWAAGRTYHGRVECTAKILYTPAQLEALSVDEIYGGILGALSYSEYEWQRETRAVYKPQRDPDGLQSILYRCPACKTDFGVTAKNGVLICENCGYSVAFDPYCFFVQPDGVPPVFDNPADWYTWQYTEAAQELAAGRTLRCRASLMRTVEGKFGYTPCGSGEMCADGSGIRFEGTCEGRPLRVAALVEHQSNVTHNSTWHGVDIEGEGCNYLLVPDKMQKLGKFLAYYVEARRRFEAAHRS